MPAVSPPSVEAVAAFIEKIHIFHGISEDDLFDIADNLQDKLVKAGEVILEADVSAQSFYIIYSGKVDVIQEKKGQRNARLVRGDYFGEDALLEHEGRHSQVKAKDACLLLELPAAIFAEIPSAVDFLREQLEFFLSSRRLTKELHFDWIEPDEAIYFLARKHIILFWRRVPIPALLILSGPALAFWGMWVGATIPLMFGSLSAVIGLLWLLWNWLDWNNDYYIVTSQRVVWLEKIIGIYDSRQEAHLPEVKSVRVESDAVVQSFFDYGHVSVSTIFGGIELKYIPHPRQAQVLIEELWHRSQADEKLRAKDKLHQAIIDQIKEAQAIAEKKRKPPPAPFVPSTSPAPAPKVKKPLVKISLPKKKKKKNGNFFTLRFQEGKDIVYRKHIIILIGRAGTSALVSLFFFVFFLYELYLSILLKSEKALSISFIALLGVAVLVALGWAIYQYVDWSNDIFKVSRDKIFDIDRKPFGDIQSRSAPLENIQSTEYKSEGLLSILFNYGTVYIHIGTEDFEFENVLDPAAVQQDINHRYKAIQEMKKEAQAKRERDEMIKWLVAYHESAEKFDEMMDELKKQKEAAKNNGEATG